MINDHDFISKVKVVGSPLVVFSPNAIEDQWHLIDLVSKEVGWLGTVRRKGLTFYVDEIFLLDQHTSGTTTEITPQGQHKLMQEIMKDTKVGTPEGNEALQKANSLLYWGHSHVDFSVGPSAQDNNMVDMWKRNGCDFMVRAIGNKRGDLKIDLFLFSDGIEIEDVPWKIGFPNTESRKEDLAAQVEEKVKPLPATTQYVGNGKAKGGVVYNANDPSNYREPGYGY